MGAGPARALLFTSVGHSPLPRPATLPFPAEDRILVKPGVTALSSHAEPSTARQSSVPMHDTNPALPQAESHRTGGCRCYPRLGEPVLSFSHTWDAGVQKSPLRTQIHAEKGLQLARTPCKAQFITPVRSAAPGNGRSSCSLSAQTC